jgi:fatty-acid peroxygenase
VATARFITFAGLALHEHPASAAWLRADVDRRALAFAQEVRRFYPFFPVIGGRVRKPFTWRGHAFTVGDWVLLGLHATNHDQRLWDGPDRFDPERFLTWPRAESRLVPQGAGEHWQDHRCPGEWITVELIRRAIKGLLVTDYTVPEQDLHVPKDRFPTLPASGFVVELR